MPKPYFKNSAEIVKEIIRVDQAGEYAAKVIYETQIQGTQNSADKQILQEMLAQEMQHLNFFNQQIIGRKVPPTAFIPLWHFLSWSLGKVSTSLGNKYSMLATDAVEDAIQEHYQEQLDLLETMDEPELKQKIAQFREDEIHHQSIARDHLGKISLFDSTFAKIIKTGCHIAIAISKKI
jgi:ubiquinone biosynthesis monooxygenase Coq7